MTPTSAESDLEPDNFSPKPAAADEVTAGRECDYAVHQAGTRTAAVISFLNVFAHTIQRRNGRTVWDSEFLD